MKISLCMIVKDEELTLARCLESVQDLVDEIIIVDTGSSDHTIDIAMKYHTKVFQFDWVDDFSKARNFAFSKATCDYQMWLDADDIIKPKDQSAFLQMKHNFDETIDIAMLKYDVGFDEQGNTTFSFYRERIMKRSMHFIWNDPVHEVITPRGNIAYFPVHITHAKTKHTKSNRNLRIYQKMKNENVAFTPRQQFYYARELCDHGLNTEAMIMLSAVIQHPDTWIENRLDAIRLLATCLVKQGQLQAAKETLCKAFAYDAPRSIHCCELGRLYLLEQQYHQAIFWYELAMKQKPTMAVAGFEEPDMYDYIPAIQLCVCYDHIHDTKKAIYYNELAGRYKPNDQSYLFNVQYFKEKAALE